LYLLFPILLFRAAGSEILFCSSWVGQIPSPLFSPCRFFLLLLCRRPRFPVPLGRSPRFGFCCQVFSLPSPVRQGPRCQQIAHGRLLLQAAEPDLGFASISRLADRFWSFVPHRFPRLGLKCCILEPFTHGDFLRSASGFAVPVSPPAFGPKPLVRYLNPPPPAAFSLPHF
jgi:hypothetical protein